MTHATIMCAWLSFRFPNGSSSASIPIIRSVFFGLPMLAHVRNVNVVGFVLDAVPAQYGLNLFKLLEA